MARSLIPNIIPVSVEYEEVSKGVGKEMYSLSTKNLLFISQAYLQGYPTRIYQLIDQIYQFSRMYRKSTNQQSLPVTIKYPEMVAEIYPYFQHDKLPDFGKESLWFL